MHYTYEMTKMKGIETLSNGMMAYVVCKGYEEKKILLESIKTAADTLLWLEDLEEAYKRGDLVGMRESGTKHGF